MFQIIVIVISIALTLLVAGVGVFYGGTAFTQGATDADAAKVAAQGSQIQGAIALYQSQNSGALPATVAELAPSYLKTIPVAPYKTDGGADGVDSAWAIDNTVPATPKLTLVVDSDKTKIPADVCSHVKADSGVTCASAAGVFTMSVPL